MRKGLGTRVRKQVEYVVVSHRRVESVRGAGTGAAKVQVGCGRGVRIRRRGTWVCKRLVAGVRRPRIVQWRESLLG